MIGMKAARRWAGGLGMVVALTVTATACGGSGDSDTPTTTTTVAATNDTVPLVKNKPRGSAQITTQGGSRR
jgi:hypothetical protein